MSNPDTLNPLPQIHIPGISGNNPAQQRVHHVFIIDASGSMAGIRQSVINGFNEQVQNLHELERAHPNIQNLVTLVIFNGVINTVLFEAPATSLAPLTESSYVPTGMTNLRGAVGETITRLQNTLGGPEGNKTRCAEERVIITIMTDGQDTVHAPDWWPAKIRQLLELVRQEYDWVVTLIGSNIDALMMAEQFSIPATNTIQFSNTAISADAVSSEMQRARSCYVSNLALRKASGIGESAATTASYFTTSTRGLDLTGGLPGDLLNRSHTQDLIAASPEPDTD